MKKNFFTSTLLFTILFSLPAALSAEELHYYSNGRKITLTEDNSAQTFIDLTRKESAKSLSDVKVLNSHRNVFTLEKASKKRLGELSKLGKVFPAYKIGGKARVFLSGMMFVKIPGQPDVKDAEKWCRSNGLRLIKQFKYVPQWYLAESTENTIRKAAEFVEKGIAKQAEPSFFLPIEKRMYIPSDQYFFNQWHLHNFGDAALSGTDHAHVAEAWYIIKEITGTLGSSEVKMAIVDDGFDLTHEDFQGRFLPGHDFGDGDDNPMPETGGLTGGDMHGTSVAGVAGAAADNDKGVAGACPNCSMIPIRLKMSGITSLDASAIEAFEWAADAGAHLISNSWGPSDGTGQFVDMNQTLKDLVATLTTTGRNGLGIIILFAAGNGNEDIALDGFASNPNVFAIGATDAAGNKASYSDFGEELDFMACSNTEGSASGGGGDGWAGGNYLDGIWTTDNMGQSGYNNGSEAGSDPAGNYTNSFGGTSSACPLAAGITGLVLSANPNLSRDQIYEIFKATSDKTGGVNYDTNGFNNYFGYGRINACEAVKKAFEMGGIDLSKVVCGEDTPIEIDTGDTEIPTDTGDTGDTETPADTGDTEIPADTGDSADTDPENGDTDSTLKTQGNGCSTSVI
ncbi:S8 family serine peptidase [bacterium]|nr:S8 family serine peptidase [bacterium]